MSGTNTRKLKKNIANAKILANLTGLNNDKKTLANLTKKLENSQANINAARIARNNITRKKYLVSKNMMLTQKNKGFKYNKNKSKVRQNFERLRILMKNNPIKGTQMYMNKKGKNNIARIEEETRGIQKQTEELKKKSIVAKQHLQEQEKELAKAREEFDILAKRLDIPLTHLLKRNGPQMTNEEAFGVGNPNPNPNPKPAPKKASDPMVEQYIRNHYD